MGRKIGKMGGRVEKPSGEYEEYLHLFVLRLTGAAIASSEVIF
jgi:hypothetical protein